MPRGGKDVSHLENSADLKVMWVVDLTEIDCILPVHFILQFLAHPRANNDQTNSQQFDVIKYFNQVMDFFPLAIGAHSAYSENDLVERYPKISLNRLFRIVHLGKIFKIDGIIGSADLVAQPLSDVLNFIWGIQDQSITHKMHVLV